VKRRAFLGASLAAATWSARAALESRGHAGDFDIAWRAIENDYAYFDGANRARWRKARERLRPAAARAPTPQLFAAQLQALVDTLRDDHVTLSGRAVPAARRIPYELDVWPRWLRGQVAIEAVKTYSDADVAGLHAGMNVTRVQDVPVERALREKLAGESAGAADIEWALRRILAGPRVGVQRMEVREGARIVSIDIERNAPASSTAPPILGRRMGEERDIGYIRVRLGAGDPDLVAHFDGALGHMSDTRALILDLRETAGPAPRDTARAILARLARPDAKAPLVVLVDRWTAGEGEQLALELASSAQARIVGTQTAGLRGELDHRTLPATGIVVSFPAARAPAPAQPHVPVNLAAPSGGPGDPILYQALKLLERR
jgi:carboxyl-terminal processing protease